MEKWKEERKGLEEKGKRDVDRKGKWIMKGKEEVKGKGEVEKDKEGEEDME